MLENIVKGSAALACLSFAIACLALANALWKLPNALHSEAAATRSLVKIELDGISGAVLQTVNVQASGLRRDASKQVAAAIEVADTRLDHITHIADDLVQQITPSLRTVLADTDETVVETNKVVHDLHPQLLGLAAAAKVAAGQAAETLLDVQRAVPGTLSEVHLIELNVAEATQASAAAATNTAASAEQSRAMFSQGTILMTNLATASKPLPWWVRYPLQLAGLAAPLASGVAGTLAATGAFH